MLAVSLNDFPILGDGVLPKSIKFGEQQELLTSEESIS